MKTGNIETLSMSICCFLISFLPGFQSLAMMEKPIVTDSSANSKKLKAHGRSSCLLLLYKEEKSATKILVVEKTDIIHSEQIGEKELIIAKVAVLRELYQELLLFKLSESLSEDTGTNLHRKLLAKLRLILVNRYNNCNAFFFALAENEFVNT